jgi:hypothetical protein
MEGILTTSRIFVIKVSIVLLLSLSLLIDGQVNGILSWSSIPFVILVRVILWIIAIVMVLSPSLASLAGFQERQLLHRVSIGTLMSFIVISSIALILYRILGSVFLTPYLLVLLCTLFVIHDFVKLRKYGRAEQPKMMMNTLKNRWLGLVILAHLSIIIAVAFSQRYMIPGDNWALTYPGVSLVSTGTTNVYTYMYPDMFAFLLSGVSTSFALPLINSYVLLSLFAFITPLIVYSLFKQVFKGSEKVSLLATTVFLFAGGLGALVQALVFPNGIDFWSLSYLTQDLYFAEFFWNDIEFFYRSIALLFAFSSIILACEAVEKEQRMDRLRYIFLSSVFIVFAFFLHMLELIIIPITIAVLLWRSDRKTRIENLAFFGGFCLFSFFALDSLYEQKYIKLIRFKLDTQVFPNGLVNTFISSQYLVLIIMIVASIAILLLLKHVNRLGMLQHRRVFPTTYRKIFAILIPFLLYALGLYVWFLIPAPSLLYAANQLPPQYYITKFGFSGFLAFMGILLSISEERNGVKTSLIWILIVGLLANLWWGARFIDYIFAPIAFLAGLSYYRLHTFLSRRSQNLRSKFRLPAHILPTAIILALSFSSTIYGAYYIFNSNQNLTDQQADVIAWLHENSLTNESILTTDDYTTYFSIQMLASRSVKTDGDITNFDELETLRELIQDNICYATLLDNEKFSNNFANFLVDHSDKQIVSDTSIYKFPSWVSFVPNGEIGVLGDKPLGIEAENGSIGWLDDEFNVSDWSHEFANVSTDGQVLTLETTLLSSEVPTPYMRILLNNAINTTQYPYLIIRFKNSINCPENIRQIITVRGTMGWYDVIYSDSFAESSSSDAWKTVSIRLPPDKNVADISIWLKNELGLTGRFLLNIDYIGIFNKPAADIYERVNYMASIAAVASLTKSHSIISVDNITTNTVVMSYDKQFLNSILQTTDVQKVIVFNDHDFIPDINANWQKVSEGISKATIQSKTLIVFGIKDLFARDYTIENLIQKLSQEIM